MSGRSTGGHTTDLRAYLFALAPTLVVVAVAPGLATLPGPGVGPLWVAGPPLVACGLGLVGWAVHSFARAGVTPSPVRTPVRLAVTGVLAHTRNPLYLGTVLAAAGVGLTLDAAVVLGYAGLLALVYHLLAVYHEEPALRATFGDSYVRYCETVPRWLPRP